MTERARPSIRGTLLRRLMLPVLLVVLVSGASAYGLARHFSRTVLDQWLYDSAIALAHRVKWQDGRYLVDLPPGAREIFEWDMVDRIYYEVLSESGERLIGNSTVPHPDAELPASSQPAFFNGQVAGVPVRILLVRRDLQEGHAVLVKVAETRHKRAAIYREVLWISLTLSLGLTVLSALIIWYGIGSGLASAEKAIRWVRNAHAAAPLTAVSPQTDPPREVMPLVQAINDLISDLSAAHRLNQRFISDAAHQLRTPLSTLRVQLEVALREPDPVRHKAALDDAVGALSRMGRTVQQLLALAKADQNEHLPDTASGVDLDLLAREEVERRIDDALDMGIDLGYSGRPEPVRVQGSRELLREAIANLLDNALLYGGRGRHVTVGVLGSPPQVYVEDRGPGIPVEERDKTRQRFYRVPGTAGDGAGLGLAIVDEIARRHRGMLVLADGAGGTGLRASLVFPGASDEA